RVSRWKRCVFAKDLAALGIEQERVEASVSCQQGHEAVPGLQGGRSGLLRRRHDSGRDAMCEEVEQALVEAAVLGGEAVVQLGGEEISGRMVGVRRGDDDLVSCDVLTSVRRSYDLCDTVHQAARNPYQAADHQHDAVTIVAFQVDHASV